MTTPPGIAAVSIPTVGIAALVLAGGKARRMGGGDKPLALLGGRPMLAWVIEALGIANTAISANGDPALFAAFGRPVLSDGAFAEQGPLAGLLAGLDWAAGLGARSLLTAPGDTPFLPRGLAQSLSPAPAAARSNGRDHHLVALWPVSIAALLRRRLAIPGPRQVGALAREIGMRHVEFVVGTLDPFLNINTVDEMEKARMRADQAMPASRHWPLGHNGSSSGNGSSGNGSSGTDPA